MIYSYKNVSSEEKWHVKACKGSKIAQNYVRV